MKKIIAKNEYDTDTATLIHKYTYGNYGDPCGYEETLYQTETGLYFIYVAGGSESLHPNEDIMRIAKQKVNLWLDCH